ncbi:MAG: DUF4831 family protein, partial [Prevotellaceae bacterium]|nr:DUF4831 family protein [Candidatus Minthosoma caballi]
MKKIIIALMTLFPLAATAQTQVAQFNPGIAAEGVNYALPKTVLKAEVTAIKTVYTPGEFAKYANRYLHISNVSSEPEVAWKIVKAEVYQEGTPDTLKCFTVKLKDKTIAPMVQLTNSGILVSVNTNQDITERKIAASTSSNHKLDARQYLTEDILAATSTAKMAELTAQEILDIRESKNAIKRGQVESMPQDGASLKIVLDELNRQEEALTQLFVGYCDTTTCSKIYSILPEGDIDSKVLFRFSKKLGFVDADDLAGSPYCISVKDQHTVSLPSEKDAAKRKIQGLVYNMPSMAKVTLSGKEINISNDMPFAQFGTIDMLNPTLFNKGVSTKVSFNPATGGIT